MCLLLRLTCFAILFYSPFFCLTLAQNISCNVIDGLFIKRQVESFDRISGLGAHEHGDITNFGCPHVIRVRNQQEFDEINDALSKAINAGIDNIRIKISRGTYYFHEDHINRIGDNTNATIQIVGNNAILTSDNNYLSTKLFMRPWNETEFANGLIRVLDYDKKMCFIPFRNNIKESEKEYITKVRVTKWYDANTYHVVNIDTSGIYFIAPDLKYVNSFGRKEYNINYDYLYHNDIPRFRLYDKKKESVCDASRFINLLSSSYKKLTISGLAFVGNKSGNALISMRNVNAGQIMIEDCEFSNIQGQVINISNTDNICFFDNKVSNTESTALSFSNGSKNVQVRKNTFENCGVEFCQSFCISCVEAEYYISDNVFRDFGYSAIGVGVWYGGNKTHPSKGIIEHNEIYYTESYMAKIWKHTLMDSGAVYVFTQNDDVIIRYNYIHDYAGAADNRGIFCDDGASNLKIYGNVICNITNSYCIDSRFSKDQNPSFNNNSHNFLAYNIIDGKVRFMGYRGEERHNIKGSNIVIGEHGEQGIMNEFEDLEIVEGDIYLPLSCYSNRLLFVPFSNSRVITKKIKDTYIKRLFSLCRY